MAESIDNQQSFERWLAGTPSNWSKVLSVRIALRVMPKIGRAPYNHKLHLATFRAITAAWAALRWPASDSDAAVERAYHAAYAVAQEAHEMTIDAAADANDVSAVDRLPAADAAMSASAAALAASALASTEFRPPAVRAAVFADSALRSSSVVWKELERDAAVLEKRPGTIIGELFGQPLWNESPPPNLEEDWQKFIATLLDRDPNFWMWRDWYHARRAGANFSFLLDPVADRKVTLRIVDQDDNFWNRDFRKVNAEIASWIEELRPDSSKTLRAEAARLASPDVTNTDGRLDIVRNAKVDDPKTAASFKDLIAILKALSARVVGDLPGNLHRTAKSSAEGYFEHLSQFDERPIMGLLDDFEFILRAAFEATDPREWEPGFPALLKRFFGRHSELKELYPQFEERDRFIEVLPLNADKARGQALAEPARQLAEAAAELSDAGLTSEAYDENVQRQLEEAKALAGPEGQGDAGLPRKKRLFARLVGFYERTVAVLSNSFKVADSPVAQSAIKAIGEAIAKLMELLHF